MDRDTCIPETRVRIDLPEEVYPAPQSKQGPVEGDTRIRFDKFGSLNQLPPGVRHHSNLYHTFPGVQSIANSTPILSCPPSRVLYSKGKSQSSGFLPSMSITNGVSAHVHASNTLAEIFNTYYSPKSTVTALASGKEAPISSNYIAQDQASSPDELTYDSGLDDLSLAEEDRLRLHAACLEGRLSVYGREAETWLRERAELSMEAASLRKRLEAMNKSCEAQELLRHVQEQLSLKTLENEQLSANLTAAQQDSIYLKSQLADVQQNSVAKDQALASLRKKISELYADMESIRMAHSQALDNKTDLTAELASLRRSQEWYREQLQLTEAARDRLMEQLNSMRKWLDQSGTSAQQLAQENARLETKVMSGEVALAEAKRNLSHELEVIRADILEREAIFEKILAERADLEALCRQKSHQITECQSRISTLQSDLSETEMEVSELRSSLDRLRHTLQCVETERDNLRATVNGLEAQMNQQNALMDQQLAQYKDVCSKLTRLEGSSYEQAGNLNRALEEKAALESSLTAIHKEKATLDACLNQLKEDMSRVESNFSALQCELDSKNSELSNVLLIRDELSNDLEVLQAALHEKGEKVKELESEREQLQNASLSLQLENEGLRDDVKRLEASIAPACEEAASKAREPLITEIERINSQSEALQTELKCVREQVASLLVDQERYCALLTTHQALQQQYDALSSAYTASMEEANAKQTDLRQRLQQVEASYSQALLTKSSEIDSLTHQLDEKAKDALALQSEIASLKVSHQQSLAQQDADWAQQLSSLESRLHAAELQRAAVEQKLQEVLERERNTNAKQQAEMEVLRAEVAKMESCVSKSEALEAKHRQLMHELEAAKGREMGLSDTVEDLKRHTASLETKLSQREVEIVELSERMEKSSMSPAAVETEVPIQPVCVQQELATAPVPVPCSNCQMLSAEIVIHSEAVSRMQTELAKVQAALELARQELAAQSAKTANEAFGRQQACEAQRRAAQQQLSDAKHIASIAQANVATLTTHLNSNDRSTSSEVHALQEAMQVMKRHLEELKRELAETKQESWHYQSNLSDLRGSLRGLIEKSQVFGSDDPSSTSLAATAGSAGSTPVYINVVGVSELEKLLVDRADSALLDSKPLLRVSSYLNRLQQEIDSLESQVIHHATVVRDSVANWRTIEEHAILIRSGSHPVPPMPHQ
ncbi:UDP galactose transporter [Echinococcus multilocularis]|uniref:UDP galactose transporter n=1 Tax=Echinococcus multilocularis TaxID=6211 RepID=A0A087W1C5_ECHMU|nr:UDP galactose transporter [Echinococcus multilocularis]